MYNSSRRKILGLDYSDKELYSRNRNKTGYNIYVSFYFSDFKGLDYETKKSVLCDAEIHDISEYDLHEEDSVVSVPLATTIDVMRIAARKWREMPADTKNAWKERAELVNNLPIYGAFVSIPNHVIKIQEDVIKKSLTQDFDRFTATIKNAIRKKTKITESLKQKQFGKERFILGVQVFRSFLLTHLLNVTMFGTNYCFLNDHEIVHRSKGTIIAHIASKDRMVELFTFNEVCPFEFGNSSGLNTCSAKISVLDTNSLQEGIGYVLEEDRVANSFTVLLECGKKFDINIPFYDSDLGSWQLTGNDEYKMLQYWPIRIKLLIKSGYCHMTFNKYILSTDNSNEPKVKFN